MIRVWFNHWFSTLYGLIEFIKKDAKEQIYVIASNQQIDSVIQKVCDEWYQDSGADGEEYLQYCLEFCMEHKVDVFIPRMKMVVISQNIEKFNAIGVKVMVDDYPIIKLLNDKVAAYGYLKDCEHINIPDYEVVNTSDEFIKAYERLHREYGQICVKFVQDEGGRSYRRIINYIDSFERLHIYPSAEIAYDDYVKTLQKAGNFDDLIVMPYLPGDEISVDCLDTSSGLIAVPRFKGAMRHEKISYDKNILEMTQRIMEKVKLQHPCNIQFKLWDGIPYLLEINTRCQAVYR